MLGDEAAAEDCVQEAFIRAYRAWPRWTPEAPAELWLQKIAINRALTFRRKMALQGIGEVLRRLGRPSPAPDPALDAGWADLRRALRRLPPKLAAAIVLRHYHGYTNREIAAAEGVSERMIGIRLEQARSRLRKELGANLDEKLPESAPAGVPFPGRSSGS